MDISGFKSLGDLEMDEDLLLFQQWPEEFSIDELIGSLYAEQIPQQSGRGPSQEGESRALKKLRSNPSCSSESIFNPSQDHSFAERKRREKLNQLFIALSALLPGLKKMDKASVLEEAIKYMRQLQDKVKSLEKKIMMSKKKCYSNERCSSVIEARSCNSEVLIRIHCERRKGVLENCVGEIEKLHLSLATTSVVPFGDSAINITVIAQMEDIGSSIMNIVDELVNNLRVVLKI